MAAGSLGWLCAARFSQPPHHTHPSPAVYLSHPESAEIFTQTICQEVWNWSQKHITAAEAQLYSEACRNLTAVLDTVPWPLTGSRVHKPSAECDSNVSNAWILPAPSGIKQKTGFFLFFFFCHLGGNCSLYHCLPFKSGESQWLKLTSARGSLPLLEATSWWNSWFRTSHQAHLSPCRVVLCATWI